MIWMTQNPAYVPCLVVSHDNSQNPEAHQNFSFLKNPKINIFALVMVNATLVLLSPLTWNRETM